MHDDQVAIDADLARAIINDQFPEWRWEPVTAVRSDGTVNAIFRIGADLAARFPLRAADPDETNARLRAEAGAMLELAANIPVPAPTLVAVGAPGRGYPLPWSVQTWIPGTVATPTGLAHSTAFAQDLASLVRALRAVDTRGRRFTGTGRGGRVRDHGEWMEVCFTQSEGLLDVASLRLLWTQFRELPPAERELMTHGDLIPANLIVKNGRLAGVLDGGGFAPADPALDLVAAWHLLDQDARASLRRELGSDPAEWRRGAAWAFVQAMGLVWYYQRTNPGMSALGSSTLARILSDPDLGIRGARS